MLTFVNLANLASTAFGRRTSMGRHAVCLGKTKRRLACANTFNSPAQPLCKATSPLQTYVNFVVRQKNAVETFQTCDRRIRQNRNYPAPGIGDSTLSFGPNFTGVQRLTVSLTRCSNVGEIG